MNAPTWRKSSHSSSDGDQCVELASVGDTVAVRDSKNPTGPILILPRRALRTLVMRAVQR